jgi:protein arginine N-methyltransferase 5
MERWERLCLRPLDEEEQMYVHTGSNGSGLAALQEETQRTADTDREADLWRKDPSLNRDECNITRFEDAAEVVALASEWLELDSFDEGIRFDSELVSRRVLRLLGAHPATYCARALRSLSKTWRC